MANDTDVLIAGGGLVGSVLALALAAGGKSIVLIEAQSHAAFAASGFDGRSYALSPASRRLLDSLGVWADLTENDQVQPIRQIKVSDGSPGKGASPCHLRFDRNDLDDGPLGFMVEDRHLRRTLLRRLESNDRVSVSPETRVTDHHVHLAGVEVELSDGRIIRATLLAGCDGRNSRIAEQSGIRRIGWGYTQSSLVCSVSHDRPHDGIAHQFFTPAGPLAILPLRGKRSSIVWTEAQDEAIRIQGLDDAGYLDCLRPVFGRFLGNIALAGDRFNYPLGLSIAERFVSDRVVLVGDSAHGIHPLAGQGLNISLKDVGALAEILQDAARRGEDIGAPFTLDRYQMARRFDASVFGAATDTINRLFSNPHPALRSLRRLGLATVNGMPDLKRQFVRVAAGYGWAVPRSMRDDPW